MAIDPKKQLPGGIQDANEAFFDSLIRHQIGLLRLSGSIRNDVFKLLDATEADMVKKVNRILGNTKGLETPASVIRMNRLIASLKATRLTAWKQVNEVWVKELTELVKSEPIFVDTALKTVVPVTLNTTLPSTELLTAIVRTRPFQGKTLRQWANNVTAADLNRIETQIKIGMVEGESSQAIARRLVGTVAQKGRNGVTQITRNNAQAITRTAVNAVSNQAKRAYYIENEDILREEVYSAVLDSRTTPICMTLDSRRYPIGEGPYPPQHIQCRSVRVAVINRDFIGKRPARAFTERQLLRDYTRKAKIPTATRRGDLARGHKGKFDEFSVGEKRRLTGTVPAKVSYQDWLTRQSASFQDDVLGNTKGKLFRKGGLKLDKFVDRAGNELTLSELATRNAEAFKAAGLDPSEFL